jgi:hypothetical protein
VTNYLNIGNGSDAILHAQDVVEIESVDSSQARDGGFLWLRGPGEDSYVGHFESGSFDGYLRFSNDDDDVILTAGGNTFIRLDTGGNIGFFEGGTGYSSLAALKSFVIDHPTDPDRLLVHVCTESPTAGVEYTGSVVVYDGHAVVALPDYFEALCEPDGRTVQLTPVGALCRVASRPIVDGRFVVLSDAPDGTRVDWLVKATRRHADFDVEPVREGLRVAGSGPYRYVVMED